MSEQKQHGLVLARYGATVLLLTSSNQTMNASVRRRLEHIACGDRVHFVDKGAGEVVVTDIETRRNALQRTDFRKKTKTLACNIDQLVIVSACRPTPDWQLVDQMIVAGIVMNVEILLLAHKSDLPCATDLLEPHQYYRKIGHTSLTTSRDDLKSLAAFERALRGKTNVLVGQSGMGKSSLASYLITNSDIKIGALSEQSGHGQHTTSVAQCYPLGHDAFLIDSPGVRDFSPPPLTPEQISAGFLEIHDAALRCKFHNCRHQKEPCCAVRAGLQCGEISESRFESFSRLLHAQQD